MRLNTIQPAEGSKHAHHRVGRGVGSGWGKTAGRGHKGQKSRAGGFHKVGFEGGQMPMYRRLPKRGFTNIFKKEYAIVNVDALNQFDNGATVTLDSLIESGLVKRADAKDGLRILGNGDINVSVNVKANHFSKSAAEKIEAAGGKAEVI